MSIRELSVWSLFSLWRSSRIGFVNSCGKAYPLSWTVPVEGFLPPLQKLAGRGFAPAISTRQSLRVRTSLISRSLWNSSKREVSRSTIRSRTLRCPSKLSETEATARARSSFKLREASPDHAYPRHRGSRACPMRHLLVDGVLGIGRIPTDVRAMDCDFYAAGFHELCGGPRAKPVLFVKPDKAVQLVPIFGAIARRPLCAESRVRRYRIESRGPLR
jgi:hypothetical protein